MNPLQQQIDALQATLAALTARVQMLESSPQPPAADGDEMNAYGTAIQERLHKKLEEQQGKYALGVTSVVSQLSNVGHSGTAFGLVTVDKADDLPSDDDIEAKASKACLFVTNSLVLRCLREFIALRFDGKPMEATSGELASRLGSNAADVDSALGPLVQMDKLRRGLRADNTEFYQWDGNNSLAMLLLFHL